MKESEAASHKRSRTPAALTVHDPLLSSQQTPKSERVAKMLPVGGAHDASNGGTGIGPVDVLSLLSQGSQESVPVRLTVVPTKAAIAAQVRSSRSNTEEDARTPGSRAAAASMSTVYAKGVSSWIFSCRIGDYRSGRCWDRTSDLCRVKAAKLFLMRSNA